MAEGTTATIQDYDLFTCPACKNKVKASISVSLKVKEQAYSGDESVTDQTIQGMAHLSFNSRLSGISIIHKCENGQVKPVPVTR